MKRKFTCLSLLLILAMVSTGPGIVWAAESAQDYLIVDDPPGANSPEDSMPGEEFECLGDPDDAITGNRYDDAGNDTINLGSLAGAPSWDEADYELWLALMTMLLNHGLI